MPSGSTATSNAWRCSCSSVTGAASPWLSGLVHERLTHLGLDLLLASLVVAAAVVLRVSVPAMWPREDRQPAARLDLDLFWAGAGVYVFSYVLFRSWDYRLAFALVTVPQLLRWLRERPWVGMPALAALFGVLWLDAQPYWLPVSGVRDVALPTVTAAQFALFACYVAALVGTFTLGGGRAPASDGCAAAA